MTPTPEMLALARRIVADKYSRIREHDYAGWVLKGEKDTSSDVLLVLAAIQRTTELAVEQAERLMTGSDADFKCAALAHAYRNFDFLKGASQ